MKKKETYNDLKIYIFQMGCWVIQGVIMVGITILLSVLSFIWGDMRIASLMTIAMIITLIFVQYYVSAKSRFSERLRK